MRDEGRITPTLNKIEELWRKHPDLRFMQLIALIQSQHKSDMFYVEDDILRNVVDKLIKEDYNNE